MVVNYGGLIAVLPEFIIAGLIAFYLNRILSYEKMRLTFKLDKGRTLYERLYNHLSRNAGRNKPATEKGTHSPFIYCGVDGDFKSVSVALITISTWILVLLSLIGLRESSIFVPVFSGILNVLLYGILIILFLISIMASLSIRVKVDKGLRILATAISIVLTVLFFYLPSMKWFMDTPRNMLITAVMVYFALLFVIILAYIFWWYAKPRKAFRISFYTSIATYAMIVTLMLLKDSALLHL